MSAVVCQSMPLTNELVDDFTIVSNVDRGLYNVIEGRFTMVMNCAIIKKIVHLNRSIQN